MLSLRLWAGTWPASDAAHLATELAELDLGALSTSTLWTLSKETQIERIGETDALYVSRCARSRIIIARILQAGQRRPPNTRNSEASFAMCLLMLQIRLAQDLG